MKPDDQTETLLSGRGDQDEVKIEEFEICTELPNPSPQRKTCIIILIIVLTLSGGILFGYDMGIISGALLQLEDKFRMDCFMSEFAVSALLIGAACFSLFGGCVVDSIGRKAAIMIDAVMFMIGAVILSSTPSYQVLIFGRFMLGIGVTLAVVSETVYVAEISPPQQRGRLVSFHEFGITLGFLFAFIANRALISIEEGWRWMFGMAAFPAAILAIVLYFLPASPRHLLLKNRDREARKVVESRSVSRDVDQELNSMKGALADEMTLSFLSLFRAENNMRGRLFLGVALVFFQQFSGQPSLMYYAPSIFQTVGFNSNTAATTATLLLGIVKVIFTLICLLLIDRIGRRHFLIVGSAIMAASLLALSLSMTGSGLGVEACVPKWMSDANGSLVNVSNVTMLSTSQPGAAITSDVRKWVALISILCYVAAYSISFGPVTWLVLSEIFPSNVKGRAVSFCTMLNWLFNLLISLTFLQILDRLGVSITFSIYSFITFLGFCFIALFLPETKNEPLEVITRQLRQWSMMGRCRIIMKKICCRSGGEIPSISGMGYTRIEK